MCVLYLKRKHREHNFSLVKMDRELKRERKVEHYKKLVILFFSPIAYHLLGVFFCITKKLKVKSEFFMDL